MRNLARPPERDFSERDLVVCQLVVRDAGRLQRFVVGGKTFDADALCGLQRQGQVRPFSPLPT